MPLFNVRNHNEGLTLIETLIVILIIGILSAVAAPSFLGMLNKAKVNDAVTKVRGALQEAQREAIRKSKSCSVTLDTTNNKVTGSCLVTGTRDLCLSRNASGNCLETILIEASSSNFKFDFKGITLDNSTPPVQLTTPVTIVLSLSSNPSFQRCLVVSVPLGIIRSGKYSGSGTVESSCTSS